MSASVAGRLAEPYLQRGRRARRGRSARAARRAGWHEARLWLAVSPLAFAGLRVAGSRPVVRLGRFGTLVNDPVLGRRILTDAGAVPDGRAGHARGADGPRDRPGRAAQHGRRRRTRRSGARSGRCSRPAARPSSSRRRRRAVADAGRAARGRRGGRPRPARRGSSPVGRRSRSSAPRRRPTATRATSRRTGSARRSSA